MTSIRFLLVFVLAAALGATARAAKFENISLSEVSNKDIAAVAKVWNKISKDAEDTGYKAVRIISRKPSESTENSLKQILWSKYVTELSVTQEKATLPSCRRLAKALIEGSARLAPGASKPKLDKMAEELASPLFDAVRDSKKVELYSGSITGYFDMSFVHITLFDKKKNEVVSIYGGYSE